MNIILACIIYSVFCSLSDKIFKPLTSPELSKYSKATSSGSIKGRIKQFGGTFNNP